MKVRSLFVITIVLTIVSCSEHRTVDKPKQEMPKALEEKNSITDIALSKRTPDDLIEELYNELAEKDTDLKKLEQDIDDLNNSKNDSTSQFSKFNGKNQSYFDAANRHVFSITDSVLRDKINRLLGNNLRNYNAAIVKDSIALKEIQANDVELRDLHTALMIVKTLPLMEEYQKQHPAASKSLGGYVIRQDVVIKKMDVIVKK
ncbi:MAG: hypothetical protein QM764_19845 [Chitinophagaceae bacterium]